MKLNARKGFTLVEMLIVVVIIGILAAALIPRLVGIQARARDTARVAHLNQYTAAVEQAAVDSGIPSGTCISDTATTSSTAIYSSDLSNYLDGVLSDPNSSRKTYGTISDGCADGSYAYTRIASDTGGESSAYMLIANTENTPAANFVFGGVVTADTTTKEDLIAGSPTGWTAAEHGSCDGCAALTAAPTGIATAGDALAYVVMK